MRFGVIAITTVVALCLTKQAFAQGQPVSPVQQQGVPRSAQIDRNGVMILIRSTLLALNHANETGNYTVLRDLAAPGFAAANTAARLGEIFASQRAQKLDLSGVAVLDPQLTLLPQIETNGMMRLAGFFPSVPSQVNFELLFAPVDGRWRVFGIGVNLSSSTPAAPGPPQPQVRQQPAQPATSGAGLKTESKAPPKATPHVTPHRGGRGVEKPDIPAEGQPGGP